MNALLDDRTTNFDDIFGAGRGARPQLAGGPSINPGGNYRLPKLPSAQPLLSGPTESTLVYVVGIHPDDGTPGCVWYWDRDDADRAQQALVAHGEADVSDIVSLRLDQLDLDGDYRAEAITAALLAWPDEYAPLPGQNRR